jgi:hypothetical protein
LIGNDLDVLAAGFDDGAQDVAADAAKAVDGDLDGHDVGSLDRALRWPGGQARGYFLCSAIDGLQPPLRR